MFFLSLLIAIIALVIAVSARNKLTNEIEILKLKIASFESRTVVKEKPEPEKEKESEKEKEPWGQPKIAPTYEDRAKPEAGAARAEKAARPEITRKVSKPKPKPSRSLKETFESFIGENLAIWVGAAALVVAGGYFIKYAYDNNLLSPWVRTGLGFALGLACIGAAEKFKQTLGRVSEGLASAGVGILFGVTWTAVNLLNLMSPGTGFALMAATAALGVLLSLRFGPVVAVVGMLGGFLTPVLMNTGSDNHIGLFLYLLALLGGIALIARQTGRYWLLTLAGLFINGWALLWLATLFDAQFSGWFSLFIVVSMVLVIAAGYSRNGTELSDEKDASPFGSISLRKWQTLVALVLTTYVTLKVPFEMSQWSWVAIMGAGLMFLERFDQRYTLFGAGGLLVPAIAFISALENKFGFDRQVSYMLLWGTFGGYGLVALAMQTKTPRRPYWAWISAASFGYIFLVAPQYYQPWGNGGFSAATAEPTALALILLGVSALMFVVTMRIPDAAEGRAKAKALSPYFLAALFFVNYIIVREVDFDYVGTILIVEFLAITWLGRPFAGMNLGFSAGKPGPDTIRLSWRIVVVTGFLFLGLVTIKNLGFDFDMTAEGPWGWPWQVELFAVPALIFIIASIRGGDIFREAEKTGFALIAALGTFFFTLATVRYLFHDGIIDLGAKTGIWEVGTYPVILGALAVFGFRKMVPAIGEYMHSTTWLFLNAALVYIGIFTIFLANPYLTGMPVGELSILNGLLWLFVPPMALVFWTVRYLKDKTFLPEGLLSALGFALLFLLITLEVRQWFTGTHLDIGGGGEAEKYAYSIAWLVSGIAGMITGIWRKNQSLRLVGLIFVSIATAKIFLYDTSTLSGLYRVGSFLGLGVSSLGIAWLYKRYVKIGKK